MTGRGQPGVNSRGRGGKFKKPTRGGGKHYSRDLRPLDAEGNEISMWSEDAQKKLNEEEDDEEDEDEDEESDDAGPSGAGTAALSREDRKKEKKARKEAAIAKSRGQTVEVGDLPPSDSEEEEDDDLPANPNHSKASRSQAQGFDDTAEEELKNLTISSGTPSRKERESLEALEAKERYRKLHEQGKTDEAKADLARLKVIREKREAEAARKQAEKEEREAQEKARKAEIEAREAKKREAALGKKQAKTKK